MKIAATCFVVCSAVFAVCKLLTEPPEDRWIIITPGLAGFFGGIGSLVAMAICAIWSIP